MWAMVSNVAGCASGGEVLDQLPHVHVDANILGPP